MIIGIQCIDALAAYADSTKPDVLPWEKGDLDWFKYITNGHIVVGGGSTYKALAGLKNREAWLASRKEMKSAEDLVKAYEALQLMGDKRNLFVCGGAEVWEAFRPYYHAFYTTVLKEAYVTDPANAKIWLPAKDSNKYRTCVIQDHYAVTIVEGLDIDSKKS